MMMRIEVFLTALALGVTMMPSDGLAFDGVTRPLPAPCAARRTTPCVVALVEPNQLPDGLAVPLPRPRPLGLGKSHHQTAD